MKMAVIESLVSRDLEDNEENFVDNCEDWVRCFCGKDEDFGGMACCELCSG